MIRLQGASYDDVSVRSSALPGDRLCRLLDEKDAQIWQLSSIHMKLARFERAMNALSEEDRQVLRVCFMDQSSSPEDAAWTLGVEKSCLYKKRNRALAHFTKALYGIIEEFD